MTRANGDVAPATGGASGDFNSEAEVSASRSIRAGGVQDWTERLQFVSLGMVTNPNVALSALRGAYKT